MYSATSNETSSGNGLNTTLVRASADLEKTLLPPLWTPRIRHQPVVFTRLGAPAKNAHGVAAHGTFRRRSTMVDTRRICLEIRVDKEGDFDRSVLQDLLLHPFHIARFGDHVRGLGLLPLECRAIVTLGRAHGGRVVCVV